MPDGTVAATRGADLSDHAQPRLTGLARAAATLVVDQPLEVTLRGIARICLELTRSEAVSIQLLNRATRGLRLAITEGMPDGYVEALHASWAAGVRSPSAQALREQRSAFITDAVATARANALYAPLHPLLDLVRWDSMLVVPLDSLGRSHGALNVYYPRDTTPERDEVEFVTALADLGAVAVENERLLGDASRAAAVEERQRLARDLHDSVSQALYGIALGCRTARTLLDRDPAEAVAPLDYVLSLADAALTEMRSLIFALRPDALAVEGLLVALDRLASALRARHGLNVSVTLPPEEPALAAEAREALYRITAEALHNTTKHAQARGIDLALRLRSNADGGRDVIELEIADDGVGFDVSVPRPGHLGLQSMRERAEALGGTLQVTSRRGHGTRLLASVPAR